MEAINLYQSQCTLGEGPYWHQQQESFFWVDIEKGVLYRYHWHTRKTTSWQFDHRVTLVVEGHDHRLILALDRRLARFDLANGSVEWLVGVDDQLPENRCNDGKCDPAGRLWVGTLSTRFTAGSGSLYRIDKDLHVNKILPDLTIANGMAWTADQKTYYFIDTPTRQVQAFYFDSVSGNITFDSVVVDIPEEMGSPDGMCIDREGKLWIAHYGGFGVYRWDPDNGELLEKVELPVPHVTSCVFGGENLDTLLVTTARENLNEAQLAQYPESGDVFLVKTETRGLLPFKCGF